MRLISLALSLALSLPLSLAISLSCAAASASAPRVEVGEVVEVVDSCLETSFTQLELNDCADRERRVADRALGRLVKRLAHRRDAAAVAKLRREQRAWQTARVTRCRRESALHEGGSILPLVYASCLADAAKARTAFLQPLTSAPLAARAGR